MHISNNMQKIPAHFLLWWNMVEIPLAEEWEQAEQILADSDSSMAVSSGWGIKQNSMKWSLCLRMRLVFHRGVFPSVVTVGSSQEPLIKPGMLLGRATDTEKSFIYP